MSKSKIVRRRTLAAACLEAMEPRQLMSVNAWKGGNGNWADATKWSAGHVPTSAEDVVINAAGDYTVTVNGYAKSLKLTVGGGTGKQTLLATNGASLDAYGTVNVLSGDAINMTGGTVYSYAAANAAATLDGTITLSGTSASRAQFNGGGASYAGAGSVVFATGGASASVNQFGGYDGTIGSGITVRGKSGSLYGRLTNKGTVKIEGTSADSWNLYNLTNQGSITSAAGAAIEFDYFKNAAGKTVSLTGGTTTFYYDFTNAGTLAVNNTTLKMAATITAGGLGTLARAGTSPVIFSGYYDGGGKAFTFDGIGKWQWKGGQLKNGTYDPTAATAMQLDYATGGYGSLNNVTLAGDLSIAAGCYLSAYGNVNLAAGKKILLNGKQSYSSGVYLYSSTLGGTGEVVFNTSGSATSTFNVFSGGTIGSGITVHGKSGNVADTTLNGLVLADTAGERIVTQRVSNAGNVMATAGTVEFWQYKQLAGGALTAGMSSATSFGKFNFADYTTAATLAGSINAVTLNGYLPTAGQAFNVATFVKPPSGTFATQNLDAGNNRGFDLTLSTTALSLKAKALTGGLATTGGTTLNVAGTGNADTIGLRSIPGLTYATVNGRTSVFADAPLTAVVVKAGAGNDVVASSAGRAIALHGEAGNDSLSGGGSNDTLVGGDGNDTMVGNGGNDTYVFANAGSVAEVDVIGEGANAGTDLLDFGAATAAVTVNLSGDTLATMANRTVKTQSAGQWANVENATGGSGADKLTGNAAANVLRGGAGNDTLTGNAGADSLCGDAGTDTLFGGDNAIDLLDGGADTDVKGSADANDVLVSLP